MKLKIEREKILPTLNLVGNVVEKRQTLPILANLYFALEKGRLLVVGTDIEVEISQIIDGVDGDDGSFTLATQKILDIIRMLPENAAISVKQEKDKAVVTSGRSRYTLKTLPADDFPRIETGDWEERFKIKQSALKALLDKTAFTMAVQDVRYYLNGVLFQLSANQLRAIATDGHRLAQSDADIKLKAKEGRELIVPRKAVVEITRFIGSEDDGDDNNGKKEPELTVEMSNNHLKLTKGQTVLITKLIDGKFPEFKGVMEKETDIKVDVNRLELIDTLTRAAVLTTANEKFRGIKLNLESGVLRVTAKNLEQEEAVEEMDVEYDGEPQEIGYNVVYLIDVARASNSERIELNLRSSDGICIMKEPGNERTIWLIMPMRI
ncbi:MAG: DNA polymerase III subunit beta [bacterium]